MDSKSATTSLGVDAGWTRSQLGATEAAEPKEALVAASLPRPPPVPRHIGRLTALLPAFRQLAVDGYHASSEQLMKAPPMNKKVQKQLDAAKKKLQNVQQQLAGARKQPDDPADIPRLEKEVANLLAEIHKLKAEA